MSSATSEPGGIAGPTLLKRILHPPISELPFWIIQFSVLAIVGIHYLADVRPILISGSFPTGVPVAVLVIPIGYSALRYGLAGSTATMVWTIILWLPDLLLPHNEGHALDDVMNLVIVILVGFIFGRRVEAEHSSQARALAVEAGYRRLFESNRSPILVLDHEGLVSDANPAATALLGVSVVGGMIDTVLGDQLDLSLLSGQVLTLSNGHDYRLDVVTIPLGPYSQHRQLNFEDVTEERSEERRSRQFAMQIVQVDEDQRRRLARELHDEPLQLFLHLARRLDALSLASGVPDEVAAGLVEARAQTLDAATRLRTMARDLRPPALDQLGLVPALSSLIAHLDEAGTPEALLEVNGSVTRLLPDLELGAFRIVQESLSNAVRHGGAHHLRATVDFTDDHLHLTIADDGCGFDISAVRTTGEAPSLGLMGMSERTRLLGGTLSVKSALGVGTVIDATLPVTTPVRVVTLH
jgi:signal transduction histidine kinase